MMQRMPLLLWTLTLLAADRTLLLSLDGLGYQILTSDPAARELRSLHGIAERGGVMKPLRPAFPSKTSAGHAAIFTGTWAGENGIYSNTNPKAPRAGHRFDESVTGFRSDSLSAKPVWTRAAEKGIATVAYQATQMYPFNARSAGVGLAKAPVVANGYQTKMLAPHAVTSRVGAWKEGSVELGVERDGRDAVRVSFGDRRVRVTVRGGFSRLLPVTVDGIRSGVYLRLFAIDGEGFLLYRTSIHELGTAGIDAGLLPGVFIGNSPTGLYRKGGFGKPVYAGGDGVAERRYLECFGFVARRMTDQMLWLDRHVRPELFIGYYPHVDDLEHVFLGLSRTGHPEVDATRRAAYALLDEQLRRLLARFSRIVVVSDHGMAPATHALHTGALLAELGWSAQQARGNASCVFLNTADWQDGVIPLAQADSERERLATALAKHPLITKVYRFAELAGFGLTGDRRPDACFDVAPLHYPEDEAKPPVAKAYEFAQGEHGFDPTRADMAAILVTNVKPASITTLAEVLSLIGY